VKRLGTFMALALATFSNVVAAQEDFPTETVTIIVPFSAGGSNDMVARYLGDQLSQMWNQPVVVENMPGAGSAIGAAHVAQQDPDGHTLMIGSVTFTMNRTVQELPFDPAEDFTPIAMLGTVPLVLVTGPALDVQTMDEFLEIARSRELKYATSGLGNVNQFAAELINQSAGLNMTPVHYKGGSEAMTDVIGGHVDLFMSSMTQAIPQIRAGEMTGLAVTGEKRSEAAPELPTLAEAGVEGVDIQQWWGIFAPADTSPEIVAKINADINKVLASEETKKFLARAGGEPVPMSPEEFDAFVDDQLQRWQQVADKAGIRAQ
jgi:tripartite-type tricarboxylate transporter receptor subunit TctC